ncbi:MAG TPA: FAD-binding oxidoreductase, partial [Leeuwenhoekiella sp.]|nr:FAD-binding oxidoreductase [Leeuwenhoekiella sp.]
MKPELNEQFKELQSRFVGTLVTDTLHQHIYATDASVYRELPLAVAFPKTVADIQALIHFAREHKTSLIPRTAGTSLAGQCVGEGIVVDVSKHFTSIVSLDEKNKTVTVQPGVIRDELNRFLSPYGLFFGPNTSTSNRCMMGGMVGNNSSGTTSIKYGVTRDKVIALKTVLSDGSKAEFSSITEEEFSRKRKMDNLEGTIYNHLADLLQPEQVRQEIKNQFPKPEIHRRNTGYALDKLVENRVFDQEIGTDFNFCSLLAGSEGTLAFTTEITLQLDDLPPEEGVMVAAHFNSIATCLQAVVPAMAHDLYTCEMMDKVILDCTLNNREQQKNRFFIEGDPKAILMLEVRDATKNGAVKKAELLIKDLAESQLCYAFPVLYGEQINQAIELRKAGLGLLGNIVGDKKAVACIEDTAVAVEDLAKYISEFSQLMEGYGQDAVYYAHAGAGELHLRPLLNLKKKKDVALFRKITTDVAQLVKKYKGSMSGEHGDGIVRAEFIPMMVGEANYKLMEEVKKTFDPQAIFNPGKIVDTYPMDTHFRYETDRKEPKIKTKMDFEDSAGVLRAAEKCNGSGDCRKLPEAGGTMCPSYRATRNEKDTTRARANALREFLTQSDRKNRFNHKELKEVFDLCLSCKACGSECPSNVDVATLKAEFEYQYKKENGSSLRTRSFAYNTKLNKVASVFPGLTNTVYSNKISSTWLKKYLHIAKDRSFPPVAKNSLRSLIKKYKPRNPKRPIKSVYLFIDEFSNYLDAEIGRDAIELLQALNYEVLFVKHPESGRFFISKGFLTQAKKVAIKNVEIFKDLITERWAQSKPTPSDD